jgi:serine/threonine protein kinase
MTENERREVSRRNALLPGTVIGGYRIDDVIGEGGMATVYSATHEVIGKRAAIKVISGPLSFDPVSVARFILEARAVNAIGHPNIIDVFSFGELPDGRNYFIMELLQGDTLFQLTGQRALGLDEAVSILLQVAEALQAAHDKGIVHRDIKPENIFVLPERNGEHPVKLLDFGLAKLADGDADARTTRAGCIMGTPSYMSPEQVRGKAIDGRADVYSLGIVAYELFAGAVPFFADTPFDIAQMQLTTAPRPLRELAPNLPEVLEALIMRMLQKEVAARPTMAEVTTALRELAATWQAPGTLWTPTTRRTEPTPMVSMAPVDWSGLNRAVRPPPSPLPPSSLPPSPLPAVRSRSPMLFMRQGALRIGLAAAMTLAAFLTWRVQATRARALPAEAAKETTETTWAPTTWNATTSSATMSHGLPSPLMATGDRAEASANPLRPASVGASAAADDGAPAKVDAAPPRKIHIRKVGLKKGRDYVLDPFNWER